MYSRNDATRENLRHKNKKLRRQLTKLKNVETRINMFNQFTLYQKIKFSITGQKL